MKRDQLAFEGMGVSGVTFAMRSATDLGGKEELHIGEAVGGEWSGQVVAVSFEKDRDGVLIRKHHVAVSKATIGGWDARLGALLPDSAESVTLKHPASGTKVEVTRA